MSLRSSVRAFFVAASAIIACTAAAQAQNAISTPTPAPTASPSPVPEIGHVVTSDRFDETLNNAVRTTYTVTRNEITQHGFRTVADAIADLPGVNVFRYGGTGSLASIGLRGSTSAQVLVLFDGLPAAGQQTGTLDLDSLPTIGIDRIEVVEGGGSSLYGAGSVGGIINIITQPLEGGVDASLRAASFGDSSLRLQTRNFAIERSVAANNYGFAGGIRDNADSQVSAAHFVFSGRHGLWQTEFSGGIVDHHLGDPGSVPLGFTTPSRENSVSRNLHASLSHHGKQSETTLEIGAASEQFLFYCNDAADPNCFTPTQALTTDVRVQASLRNTVRSSQSKLVYGIDLSRGIARLDDGASGTAFSTPPDIVTNAYAQAALYAEDNWLWGRGNRAYIGVRGERDGGQGGIIAPSAGILWRLSAPLTLRANYATAFRAPSVEDLYFPGGFGNPNLQPERVRVADLRLSDAAVLGGASMTWFSSYTTNKIVPGANFAPQNIGHARIEGATAELRTPSNHRIYARLNITDLYRAVDTTTNLRISAAGPVFSVIGEVGFLGEQRAALESWGLIASSRGAQYYSFSPAPAPGYTRLDGFVRWRLNPDTLLSLRLYDLGDKHTVDVPGYPQPGRSFAIELSTR